MGVDPRMPWILIHPGSTAASRRYPPTQFAAAARLLYRRLGVPIVFGGSASEVMLVERVRRAMGAPSFSIAGELTLGECAASIALARVLIANNSGPVHIAAALGTPVVDLYALTNPQHTPWRVPHRVLFHDVPCRWCYRSVCPQGHHACLREVAPAQVVDAALQLLDARSGASTALPEVA
jgi:ADP-heptose:LPS heptosyltransferase